MKRINLYYLLITISSTYAISSVHAQSADYFQTTNWLLSNHIFINDPTPPAGFEKIRDCDSNIIYKKIAGDTITFYSLATIMFTSFEDMVKLQKRPYFNATVYPQKIEDDGSVLLARLSAKMFLLRHDSVFLLDNTVSKIASIFQMLDNLENLFAKNIDSLSTDVFGFTGSAAFRAQDAIDLDNLNRARSMNTGIHPPYFKLIYHNNMFQRSNSIILKRRPIVFEGKKAAIEEKVDLIKTWDQKEKKVYLIRFNQDPKLGNFSDVNDFTFITDGTFLNLENCQVDIK